MVSTLRKASEIWCDSEQRDCATAIAKRLQRRVQLNSNTARANVPCTHVPKGSAGGRQDLTGASVAVIGELRHRHIVPRWSTYAPCDSPCQSSALPTSPAAPPGTPRAAKAVPSRREWRVDVVAARSG
jgi:hypothetical protein